MTGPVRILVVEDDPADRGLVVHALESSLIDIAVHTEESRNGLLTLLDERFFDVVITDYMLLGLSGLDVIDMVRKANPRTPIIMLTGTGTEEVAIEAMRRGVTDYVIKTVEHIKRLPVTVERALESAEQEIARDGAEAALRESEERSQLILDAVSDGSRDWNIVTGHVNFSDRWIESLGYTREDVTPDISYWRDRIHPDDIDRVLAVLEAHLRGETPEYKTEYRLLCESGTYRPNLDQGMVVARDEDGRPLRMLGTDTDVSELARTRDHEHELEQRLHQKQKMAAVGTLAGGIAHDFNNILHAILGYCAVAQASDFEDKELLVRCFTQIEKGGKRAADLVDQLLTFSRSQETAREAVSPAPIVLEALKLLRSILPSIIEIVADIAENCGPVVTNSTEIHQILMNLCANAAQAMEENGGTIRLTMHDVSIDESALTDSGDLQAGNYVLLTVEDSGPGIPPGDLARIFEPFFTTKEPGKGTGLGLATVHGLVTSMGGAIGVESELGRGAVFRIYFPRSEDPAVESERHGVEQGSVPNKPGRVLVVDDEEAITELLVAMLEARGYAVDAYNDVAAALAVFRVDPRAYDVAILDYTMPGKTGVELAHEFFSFNPELPVILATGHLDVPEALSDSPNIVETLKKPYGVDDLVEALNRAL